MSIDVRPMLELWGEQKRNILGSTTQGWAGRSLTDKFLSLHDGAASGTQRISQFVEEGHTGDGLLVARAIRGAGKLPPLKLEAHNMLFVNYVMKGKNLRVKNKAPQLGVSVSQYWKLVGEAEARLEERVILLELSTQNRAEKTYTQNSAVVISNT